MKIRLAKPYFGENRMLLDLIDDVLDEGHLSQGRYVVQFEQSVAHYLGIRHAIAVSSGTAALHLSLIALGVGPGDEVIVPAYTFPATANVVELVGAKPVFIDVGLDTCNIDVCQILPKLSSKTKAIIPVHLFGNPADMDPILEIAKAHRLAIVEDAAASLGAEYGGRKCGTIGTVGCFSFHPRKIVTTGEGGMLVTEDADLAEKVRCLRTHGMDGAGPKKELFVAGLNYRMNEIEALLGISQMRQIRKLLKERGRLAKLYADRLKHLPIVYQKAVPSALSSWQSFVIRLPNGRLGSILEKLKKKGIEASIGSYAVPFLKFFKDKYDDHPGDYENASTLDASLLALPFYNGMTELEVVHVSEQLRTLL